MIENLNDEQLRAVARFLLYRMGLDTRGAMMAELPVHYSRMFPSVDPAVIIGRVTDAITVRP